MVDTPKETAAKIEAVAKDVVGKSGDAAGNAETLMKENARRGGEAVRGMARKADETFQAAQNTAAEGVRAATTEIPSAVRDVAERGVLQLKDAYTRFRKAAEDTTGLVEESYGATTRGVTELQLKMLETAKQNTTAVFDHIRDLTNARSFSEAVELQTAFARRQFESFSTQMKDVTSVATRVTTDAARPMRVGLERSTESFRKSA